MLSQSPSMVEAPPAVSGLGHLPVGPHRGASTGVVWHSLAPNQIFLWDFWEGVACCVEGENLGPAPSADQLRPGLGSVSLPRGLSWVASRQRVLPAPALGHPSCTKDAPLSPCLGGWALLAARVFSSLLS